MMMKKNMANMQNSLANIQQHKANMGRPSSPSSPSSPGLGQNAANMQQHAAKMAALKERLAGAAGRPVPGRPSMNPGSTPDKMFRGDVGSSTPFSTLKPPPGMKKGGKVKSKKMMDGGMAYSKGGSASSRADGIARKGKTKGKMV